MKKFLLASCLLAVLGLSGCEQPDGGGTPTSPTVAIPTVDVAKGEAAVTVKPDTGIALSTATEGAVIYYTLDGLEPTTDDTRYKDGEVISISDASDKFVVLRAIAFKDGVKSPLLQVAYTLDDNAVEVPGAKFTGEGVPDAWATGGAVSSDATITVVVPDGTTVHYTKDNTNPTAESDEVPEGSIEISSLLGDGTSVTLKVIAVKGEGDEAKLSPIKEVTYSKADVTWTATADGSDAKTSEVITFTFDPAVSGLSKDNITVTDGTGSVTTGELTGSGTTWTLALTEVKTAGDVLVKVRKGNIDTVPKTVEVKIAAGTSAVSNLEASVAVANTVTLTWTAPTATDFDHVEITWTPGGPADPVTVGNDDPQTYTATGLTAETEYTFSVTPVNSDGSKGDAVTVKATPQEADAIPYSIEADGASDTETSTKITFTFTFDEEYDEDEFELAATDITVTDDVGSVTTGELTGDGTSWELALDEVKTPGNVYVTISKAGIDTGRKSVTVHKDVTPPAEVTGLEGTPGDGNVVLSWTDPTDGDFDHVEISYGTETETVDPDVEEATITGLTNGTAYTFTVKTVDKEGNESAVETYSYTVATYTAAQDGGVEDEADSTGITFTFIQAVTGLTADDIALVVVSGGVAKGSLTGDGTSRTLGITVTEAGSVSVSIKRVDIETAAKTVPVYKDTTAPAAVTGFDGTAGDTTVALVWEVPDSTDLDHFELTWSPSGPGTPERIEKTTESYTASNLTNGTAYTFSIKSVDKAGNESAAATVTKTPLAPTGIFKVTFDKDEDEEIDVGDVEGEKLSWFKNESLTVEVTGEYDSYEWALNENSLDETGSEITLEAKNLGVKEHTLTIRVTKDNVSYSKTVTFEVTAQ